MNQRKNKTVRVGKTKVVPISIKILAVFIVLMLLSTFASNIISSMLSQHIVSELSSTILADNLKQVFTAATNQYQVFKYSGDKDASINVIKKVADNGFTFEKSVSCAFDTDGNILYIVSGKLKDSEQYAVEWKTFPDEEALHKINDQLVVGNNSGLISFTSPQGEYRGVYKYQKDWNLYFLRSDLVRDTQKTTYINFAILSGVALVIMFIFIWVGLSLFNKILKNVGNFSRQIYDMQQEQKMSEIDISKAPNDDVTYFAASFNSLSASVNNLLSTFRKYVPRDIVEQAYAKQEITLEGKQKELTIMFSDIKSFTYRTEILGNEIIDLLNVHYDRVIHLVHKNNGIIGSIIGDAILGIYGLESKTKKSLSALTAAWEMTKCTAELRNEIVARREEIEKKRSLTLAEERVYKACLVDIGVGLDGGKVFYGNIGSEEHMANTVIGDNVNSASRIEGLTRIYFLPILVSEYIKKEVEKSSNQYDFIEIDTVQVKGKTEGSKIYFPFDTNVESEEVHAEFEKFSSALKDYYSGDWISARRQFKEFKKSMEKLESPYSKVAEVFIHRMGLKNAPENWSGIWAMTTK